MAWRGERLGPIWALALLLVASCSVSLADGYTEELLLQQLPDGATLAHFEFSSSAPAGARHAGATFPVALLGLLQRHSVRQLELSLTQGRPWAWEREQQGQAEAAAAAAGQAAPLAGAAAAAAAAAAAGVGGKPPGLELKVTFSNGTRDTQAAYASLTQALGGLLCAGVAAVPQSAVMAAPRLGWFPQQQPAAVGATAGHQVYAWLPGEALCGENLAAWARLLPCRQHAGLAALLQPLQLAAAPYYSLGLQLWLGSSHQPHSSSGSGSSSISSSGSSGSQHRRQAGEEQHLRQLLSAVLPPTGLKAAQAPAAAAAQARQLVQPADLLAAAFGSSSLPAACPVAASSRLYVAQPPGPAADSAGATADSSNSSGSSDSSDSSDGDNSSCRMVRTPSGPLLSCDATLPLPLQPPSRQPASSATSGDGRSAAAAEAAAGAAFPVVQPMQPTQLHSLPHPSQPQPLLLRVAQHVVQRGSNAGTLFLAVQATAAAGAAADANASSPRNKQQEEQQQEEQQQEEQQHEEQQQEEQQQEEQQHQGTAGGQGGRGGQGGQGGQLGGGPLLLHVLQLLPWQVMVDEPSVRLDLDGRVLHAAHPRLAWQSIQAGPDRTAVIELLLQLPPAPQPWAAPATTGGSNSGSTGSSSSGSGSGSGSFPSSHGSEQQKGWHELLVSVHFRPAFLGSFDHAPDASRGVDIPPAVATLVPAACANLTGGGGSWGSRSGSSSSTATASSSTGTANTGTATSSSAAASGSPLPSPLLGRLQADCGLRQQYSGGGAVVLLPLPDFSMPFNVICFTSTLLAILFGGVANVVLRRPEEFASKPAGSGTPVWKRKLRRMVALLLLMAVLAVQLDRNLQRQAEDLLHSWGLHLGRTPSQEQHGEL